MSLDGLKLYEKLRKKYTKYRIWKETGITTATMLLWDKKVFQPSKDSISKMKQLLSKSI